MTDTTTTETPAEDFVALALHDALREANREIAICQADVDTLREELQARELRLARAVEARTQIANGLLAHDSRSAQP